MPTTIKSVLEGFDSGDIADTVPRPYHVWSFEEATRRQRTPLSSASRDWAMASFFVGIFPRGGFRESREMSRVCLGLRSPEHLAVGCPRRAARAAWEEES